MENLMRIFISQLKSNPEGNNDNLKKVEQIQENKELGGFLNPTQSKNASSNNLAEKKGLFPGPPISNNFSKDVQIFGKDAQIMNKPVNLDQKISPLPGNNLQNKGLSQNKLDDDFLFDIGPSKEINVEPKNKFQEVKEKIKNQIDDDFLSF